MASAQRPAFLRWMAFTSAAIYSLFWIRDDPSRLTSHKEAQGEIKARTADRLVTISPEERAWLERVDAHAPIEFMPPLLSGIETSPKTLDGRAGAIFIAGWLGGGESPNVDALRWYCNEVLPHVRAALPHFRTIVTGKNPPPAVQALASDAIVLTGFVESLAPLYRNARVAIVPMRIGAAVAHPTSP